LAALLTKEAIFFITMTARWANKFQFSTAFFAELGLFLIIKLAFWAFHGSVLQKVEGKMVLRRTKE